MYVSRLYVLLCGRTAIKRTEDNPDAFPLKAAGWTVLSSSPLFSNTRQVLEYVFFRQTPAIFIRVLERAHSWFRQEESVFVFH